MGARGPSPASDEKAEAAAAIAELRSRLTRALAELESANVARRQLEEQARRTNEMLATNDARAKDDIASSRARMQSENDRLRQEGERHAQEARALGEKLKEIQDLRIQAEIRLAETASSLEKKTRSGQEKLAQAQATAASQLADLKMQAGNEIQNLKRDVERRSDEATALIGRIKELETSRDASESMLAETRAELEHERGELASRQGALDAAENRILEIESVASAAATAAGENIRDMQSRLDAASARIGELEEGLSATQGALTAAEKANAELVQKLDASDQGASRLRLELEGSQNQAAAFARDLNIAREDSAKSRQERALMRSEREATRTEANRLRREVHEAIDRLQRTTSVKDRLEEDLREAMAELESFRSGEMVRENKVLKGIIERRNAEAQKEREEMVRSRKSLQSLRRWVVLLIWVAGFSLIAAIIEAVLLWANVSPP